MNSSDKDTKKTRYEYIDILRIIGCLMVIYIHTYEHGYYRYTYSFKTFTWIWDFFLADLVQTGVPLFLAISGSLLLKKEETIKQTYKRIPRFLFDLVFFSVIYICLETISYGKPIVPMEIFTRMIKESYLHIWYLYAHIALILTLPFLRPMVKGLSQKTGIYLLVIASLFAAIISITGGFGINLNYRYNLIWTNMILFIYPVEGYILDRLFDIDEIRKKHLYVLMALALSCYVIDLLCEAYFLNINPDTLNDAFLNSFNIIKVATLFIIIKKLSHAHKHSPRSQNLISKIASCTFGIYLIHLFVLDRRPIKYLWYAIEGTSWGQYFGVYISCIGTFAIAFIIIYICRKIPIIKKMF